MSGVFRKVFGVEPGATAQAPARANLLGEHTDYNGGFVLPTPLQFRAIVEAGLAEDGSDGNFAIHAAQFDESVERRLGEPRRGDWSDYGLGCLTVLSEAGIVLPPMRFAIDSDVPMGAGISSSAALEVAVLRSARALLGLDLDDVEIAKMGQRAENGYVGMQCGIMDQMVSSLGTPGKALFLDTRDLSTELVDLPAGERIAALPEPLNRRARHVVTENQRVVDGVAALKAGDIGRFGALMDESHVSQRDDYEVSIPEIDALVESGKRHGAIGARLTGGGFGGSMVALVPNAEYERWLARVLADRPAARVI